MSNWTAYTDVKAGIANVGQEGHIFAGKFKEPMANELLFTFIGTLFIDGLCPSPQLKNKMHPHSRDHTHGNNFIASKLGGNAELNYKIFCHFVGYQDPLTVGKSKES